MTEHTGLTTPNIVEAETDRALVACARRVVVSADHSKWGVIGLAGIAGLDQVDVLVTDSHLPRTAQRALGRSVGRLVVAGHESSAPRLVQG